ncbi:hypothetical protein KEJ18_02085 [Candidatus Bathyarchaeota archaeon]|nr:hypothetical protein [Candidatus Bathyarchaeota archaeon]
MYSKLLEAWKKEKETAEIQPLTKGFYADLVTYIKRIREERRMLDERTVRGRLLLQEEENIRRMTEELIQARYKKMVQATSIGETIPAVAIAEEEESIYKNICTQVDCFQSFIKNLLLGKIQPETKKISSGHMVVRFLKEIPEIVGVDMRTYGPFKPEDVASLPKENASSLVKQGVATEVETQ